MPYSSEHMQSLNVWRRAIDQCTCMSDIVNSILKPDDVNAMLQNSDFFRTWGNVITLGTMHFVNENNVCDKIIN